jgi:hypothetical protein
MPSAGSFSREGHAAVVNVFSIMLGSQAIWSMAHCASRRMALPRNGPIKTPFPSKS